MRRLLVLFLCLLLPLQGSAAWQVPALPCPMQEMMAMDDQAGEIADTLVEAMDDCCNDLATFERTGQPCKSIQSCATPAAGMPSVPSLAALTSVTQDPRAPAWRNLPPGATTRLWRPPTSV
ncbi:hypothetical protein [Hydrogenophaga sp.]|uniref:hypothetical protein n=1 Tax=Hydrogenophaga sp. TaxID=1904254 RepID=UPI0025BDE98D|nr:hypothetical protein [Hydrogenophaga sp.]MBT9465396.1 hypothetical protein [Hydrogenophaga sp.]